MSEPSRVAITGLGTFLGLGLAEALLERSGGPRVVGLDLERPLRLAGRIDFHRVDLAAPMADVTLADILADEGVDVLVHLAFRRSPTRDLEADHDLETIGSLHVLNAAGAAKVRRVVVESSTMVYGPRRDNPNYLGEDHPLSGHPDAHCVMNRVEVEGLLAEWARAHPDVETTVLRHCWVMGPTYRDHVVRYFERSVVPTPLGYDPLIQLIHEDDLLDVFLEATVGSHPGVFNVVAPGVLPLSGLLALAGKTRLPLPGPLLDRAFGQGAPGSHDDSPSGFYDYLRYLWVAAGERGWEEFGPPLYTTKEAWIAFVGERRLRRYR